MRILVTGAAGLIGGELCARLNERGHEVTALVHRRHAVHANDGSVVKVAHIQRGDVRMPGLGLDNSPRRLDLVIHCAAMLEFEAPAEDLAAVNVEGTRNAAALARETGARLLHVSTAYVCGLRDGPIAEAPVPPGTVFANNYEASKAAAEAVVRESGVPYAIARPSIVLGDSGDGAIREFPSICNIFRQLARGTIRTLPISASATLDLVPIDFVAQGLALLAERMDRAEGRYLHLASGEPMPAADLIRAVERQPHFPFPRIVSPEAFAHTKLVPSERRVLERVLASYGSYFRRDPRFDNSAFRAITGLDCPPTDALWVDRLIAYGIASGYLPDPAVGRGVGGESALREAAAQRISG